MRFFFLWKRGGTPGAGMIIIMNGKIDTNLVQYDSQKFLRSHRLIGI
jgi:hypothetical protein